MRRVHLGLLSYFLTCWTVVGLAVVEVILKGAHAKRATM